MANKEMKTWTVGNDTYEIVDATARKDIAALEKKIAPNVTQIMLSASGWTKSADGRYHTQAVTVAGATSNSRIDLSPSPEDVIQLMEDEVSLFVGNNNGTILVYSYNGVPSVDMTIKVFITEVVGV